MSNAEAGTSPGRGAVVFEARGLAKVYGAGAAQVHALRGVDLDLFAAEFVVLPGPSGSGRSTVLNILGGLDRASGGTVSYRGRDLTRATERELTEFRRFHVGFVFQFYNLIPSLTAVENVSVVTDIAKAPMPPGEALSLVGLGERLQHFPAQLSGGEQQLVSIPEEGEPALSWLHLRQGRLPDPVTKGRPDPPFPGGTRSATNRGARCDGTRNTTEGGGA